MSNKIDLTIYIICAVAVLLCFVFYMNTAIVAERINNHCAIEFEEKCINAWRYQDNPYEPYNLTERYPVLNLSNWVLEVE